MTWKEELLRLKHADLKARYPSAYEASGGESQSMKPYTDKTSNGLTNCIIDFLTFKGHYANRIETQGQARVKDIQRFNIFSEQMQVVSQTVQWTKGNTRRGTGDIHAIIFGRLISIEIKIGKDKLSEHQIKEKSRIERAGGIYYVARDMDTFYKWYYENFSK